RTGAQAAGAAGAGFLAFLALRVRLWWRSTRLGTLKLASLALKSASLAWPLSSAILSTMACTPPSFLAFSPISTRRSSLLLATYFRRFLKSSTDSPEKEEGSSSATLATSWSLEPKSFLTFCRGVILGILSSSILAAISSYERKTGNAAPTTGTALL